MKNGGSQLNFKEKGIYRKFMNNPVDLLDSWAYFRYNVNDCVEFCEQNGRRKKESDRA